MESKTIRNWAGMLTIVVVASTTFGQTIDIRYDAARVLINPMDDAGNGSASYLTSQHAPDYLSQDWWWYRVDGVDSREHALPSGGVIWNNGTDDVTYSYQGAGSGLFDFQLESTLRAFGHLSSKTILSQYLMITNATNGELRLSVFHYIDINVEGHQLNTADWDPQYRGQLRITDPAGGRYSNLITGSGAPYITQYAPNPELLNLLTDSDIDHLDGTGIPFSLDDWTGGLEATMVLAPHQSMYALTIMSTNRYIPAPGTFAVLGMGGLALTRRRRRRD